MIPLKSIVSDPKKQIINNSYVRLVNFKLDLDSIYNDHSVLSKYKYSVNKMMLLFPKYIAIGNLLVNLNVDSYTNAEFMDAVSCKRIDYLKDAKTIVASVNCLIAIVQSNYFTTVVNLTDTEDIIKLRFTEMSAYKLKLSHKSLFVSNKFIRSNLNVSAHAKGFWLQTYDSTNNSFNITDIRLDENQRLTMSTLDNEYNHYLLPHGQPVIITTRRNNTKIEKLLDYQGREVSVAKGKELILPKIPFTSAEIARTQSLQKLVGKREVTSFEVETNNDYNTKYPMLSLVDTVSKTSKTVVLKDGQIKLICETTEECSVPDSISKDNPWLVIQEPKEIPNKLNKKQKAKQVYIVNVHDEISYKDNSNIDRIYYGERGELMLYGHDDKMVVDAELESRADVKVVRHLFDDAEQCQYNAYERWHDVT